jgi:hypothetical protein
MIRRILTAAIALLILLQAGCACFRSGSDRTQVGNARPVVASQEPGNPQPTSVTAPE